MSSLSLYIPRVFNNIPKQKIFDVFDSLNIGKVSFVDFVPREDSRSGETYNMAFVHFVNYYDNIASNNFQEKVRDPKHEAKIVYDDPWYWICLPNSNPKPDSVRELETKVSYLETSILALQGNIHHLWTLMMSNSQYMSALYNTSYTSPNVGNNSYPNILPPPPTPVAYNSFEEVPDSPKNRFPAWMDNNNQFETLDWPSLVSSTNQMNSPTSTATTVW